MTSLKGTWGRVIGVRDFGVDKSIKRLYKRIRSLITHLSMLYMRKHRPGRKK